MSTKWICGVLATWTVAVGVLLGIALALLVKREHPVSLVGEIPRLQLTELVQEHLQELVQDAYDAGYTAGYDAGLESDSPEWEDLQPLMCQEQQP